MTFCGSSGQIIHVPADYPTFQQAINATDPGDTVLVGPGTYYELLYINNKAITLLHITSWPRIIRSFQRQ